MTNIDNIQEVTNLDKSNAAGSIEMLPSQVKQAWVEAYSIDFPEEYKKAKNIIICGMGGSAYGARIVKSVYDTDPNTKISFELANGYHLPGYASNESLVFLCSYSGTTEETLACSLEAEEKKAMISGVTSGGPLGEFLKEGKYPSYVFTPTFNPSKQPRIGVGYMVVGLLAMLSKLGRIDLKTEDVLDTITYLTEKGKSLNVSVPSEENEVKTLAKTMNAYIPVFIVADFLEGAAHAIRNPIHETGKQFGLYFTVPELNHHLMEGLKFPIEGRKSLKFIFIESSLYEERNQKRMKLTKEVVEKNGLDTVSVILKSQTKFAQTLELIQLGGWFTFYLAMLNGIDPSPVPWVDYFKKELVK